MNRIAGKRSTTRTAPARSAPNGKPARASRQAIPLTTSRPELLTQGRDRQFRHLVHALFGFASHHERIRSGHGKAIGLAGIEYTVLISIAHLAVDGDVNVKIVADHLYLSGAFITSVTQRLLRLRIIPKRIHTRHPRPGPLPLSH